MTKPFWRRTVPKPTSDNDEKFRMDVWILNQTGVKVFIRVDEFEPNEICFTVSLEQLPDLDASTFDNSLYYPGMVAVGEVYPNGRPTLGLYQQYRLIVHDQDYLEAVIEEQSNEKDKNSKLIIYSIKPKHSLPSSADNVGNN